MLCLTRGASDLLSCTSCEPLHACGFWTLNLGLSRALQSAGLLFAQKQPNTYPYPCLVTVRGLARVRLTAVLALHIHAGSATVPTVVRSY